MDRARALGPDPGLHRSLPPAAPGPGPDPARPVEGWVLQWNVDGTPTEREWNVNSKIIPIWNADGTRIPKYTPSWYADGTRILKTTAFLATDRVPLESF